MNYSNNSSNQSIVLRFHLSESNFEEVWKFWLASWATMAIGIASGSHPDYPPGLLGFGFQLTTLELTAARAAQAADPHAHLIRDELVHEQFPADADALTQNIIKDFNKQVDIYNTASAAARVLIINTCDPVLRNWLDEALLPGELVPRGLHAIPHHALLAILKNRYLVLSAEAMMILKAQLSLPLAKLADFEVRMARDAVIYRQLVNNQQPESELSKAQYLQSVINAHPALRHAHRNYIDLTPLTHRTWTAAVAYIAQHIADGMDSQLTMAEGIHHADFDSMVAAKVAAQVALHIAALTPAPQPQSASVAGRGRGGRPSAGGRGSGGGRGASSRYPAGYLGPSTATQAYCWYHGMCGHSGDSCVVMTDAKGYTLQHRKATHPVMIGGYMGHP
jgi:uncharacterized membrane protein YgcG